MAGPCLLPDYNQGPRYLPISKKHRTHKCFTGNTLVASLDLCTGFNEGRVALRDGRLENGVLDYGLFFDELDRSHVVGIEDSTVVVESLGARQVLLSVTKMPFSDAASRRHAPAYHPS
jgi:hypothetical protein